MLRKKIGFLGCGKMANALIQGFLKTNLVKPTDIYGFDIDKKILHKLQDEQINICMSNSETVKKSEIVFLCTKPQSIHGVLSELKQHDVIHQNQLYISIIAGITTSQISKYLHNRSRIVRVMPNTPCLVQCSTSIFSLGKMATEEDARLVYTLFSNVGKCWQLDETLMDAVTGLSGSGPAYIFLIIEALVDGGVKAGLPRDIAQELVLQTFLGSVKMITDTNKTISELKGMVTSPAGTTITGLFVLEDRAVRGAFIEAIQKATERSKELSSNGFQKFP